MITPDWPAPAHVQARFTTRDDDLNVGLSGEGSVHQALDNRQRLQAMLRVQPCWLDQVHGADVVDATLRHDQPPKADASVADAQGVACVVMVADCLPVLLTSVCGRVVGAAHGGWRGLAAGVLQNTVQAMRARLPKAELMAWLGPAIGPAVFEVGPEVRQAMCEHLPMAGNAFASHGAEGKYLANLFELGRQALAQVGVDRVYGGSECTYTQGAQYYSFRRERVTGRHAALIWIQP
ncbi:MAG TPA: peptidoglycan editing factor PgeF [Burkholderiaceae bacterium]|nr:peptidoglycan editing factor PgeF [Burkholderiaceae bacterium]